jgi:hypothetical protein
MKGRWVGVAAGVVVGALFSGAALHAGGSEDDVQHIPLGLLIAGAVGGLLVGPVAWDAKSRTGWLGAMVAFGLVAAVSLDLVAAAGMALYGDGGYSTQPVDRIGTFTIFFGYLLLITGWLEVPLALIPAAIWALLVWAMRRIEQGHLLRGAP